MAKEELISRVWRSKAQARVMYDRLSRWYDWLADRSERPCREAGLALLRAGAKETVLEVGFGTGHGLLALARAVGAQGKVMGIDISEGMKEVATKRLKAAHLDERVELLCADALSLPLASGSAHKVFMSFTLELFDTPEIPVVLEEVRRILQTGGHLGVVALANTEPPGFALWLYEWMHLFFPRLVDCRPIFTVETLKEARFQILKAQRMSMWGLPVDVVLGEKK